MLFRPSPLLRGDCGNGSARGKPPPGQSTSNQIVHQHPRLESVKNPGKSIPSLCQPSCKHLFLTKHTQNTKIPGQTKPSLCPPDEQSETAYLPLGICYLLCTQRAWDPPKTKSNPPLHRDFKVHRIASLPCPPRLGSRPSTPE